MIIGNTFPMTLVPAGANVIVQHSTLAELKRTAKVAICTGEPVSSYWGHKNTLNTINKTLGFDITPESERPALKAGQKDWFLPLNGGGTFATTLWVVAPIYADGFRPAIGVEVTPEQIQGWQVLKVSVV